jgi:2-polyprenyl-3-methyl-5-hydroxy-6-metoxy-1,4-benzoquinol methylase
MKLFRKKPKALIIEKQPQPDANKEILDRLEKLEHVIKSDLSLIFQYISNGIELHPSYAERVVINDVDNILNNRHYFPQYYYAHIKRYMLAVGLIKKTDAILDIACGTGYGSKILSGHAKSVVGADISTAAVGFAGKMNSGQKNLKFVQADALSAKVFKQKSFDKIVSFETLEHVPEKEMHKMLGNFYDWLKPGGMFIGSTPNELVAPWSAAWTNHFKHYTAPEIKKIMRKIGFKNITIFYQFTDDFGKEDKDNQARYFAFTATK